MKVLDLFCGAGGAGEGYRRAGFDVFGVDIEPHDYKPGGFRVMDALAALTSGYDLSEFDLIHASPPCQRYSTATGANRDRHPDLIAPLRELLNKAGIPYVIENVPQAPLL